MFRPAEIAFDVFFFILRITQIDAKSGASSDGHLNFNMAGGFRQFAVLAVTTLFAVI